MIVTCGLIIKEERILAVQRGYEKNHAGKWEFPGGKVKDGEKLAISLQRELKEELDIEVEIAYALDTVFHNYSNFYIELIPFVCEIILGEILLNEHIAMKWCSFKELETLDFTEADQIIIQRIKKAGRMPALGNSDKK